MLLALRIVSAFTLIASLAALPRAVFAQAAPQPAPVAAQPAPVAPAPAPGVAAQAVPSTAAAAPAAEDKPFDLAAALREGAAPLSPDDAAAQAVRAAPSAARSRAVTQQARIAADAAFAAVFPRLDLTGSYTRLSEHSPARMARVVFGVDTPTDPTDDATADIETFDVPENQYLLQAALSFPVSDVFLTILPRYEAQKKLAELQAVREKSAEHSIALQAKEAYYAYARARAAKLIADSALAQTEAQRRDVEALVKGGALARVELMRAEAQVAAAQVAVSRSKGNVGIAGTALRSLLHAKDTSDYAVTEDLTQPLPPLARTQEDVLKLALANRSELKALRDMVDVHERTIDYENMGRLPKLSVAAQYDFANPNQRAAPSDEKFVGSWAVVGTLSWSPNDYVVAAERANLAAAERAATEADLRALEDALRTEVAQAYEDYGAAQQAMDSALTGIRAAEETYRVRREQFRAGSAVARDVIDAETDLRRARLELVSAAIDARVASARMARSTEGAMGSVKEGAKEGANAPLAAGSAP